MSNELVPFDFSTLPATSVADVAVFEELAKGGGYLKRLQLFSPNSKAVIRRKIQSGHFGIVVSKDEIIDLGESVDALPLCKRPKAVDTKDRPIRISYDPNSAEFRRIKAEANSGKKDTQCTWGPSFLVIVRGYGLAEFYLGSPTQRPEAQKVYPFLPLDQAGIDALKAARKPYEHLKPHGPLPMTLRPKLIETQFSWYVPIAVECSTPFGPEEMPDPETLKQEIFRFLNVKDETQAHADDEIPPERPR